MSKVWDISNLECGLVRWPALCVGDASMRKGLFDRRALLQLIGGAAFGVAAEGRPVGAAEVRPKITAKPHTIVLDPGHGGIDPGAIGYSGIYEKEVALVTAKEVARQLEVTKHYKVVLTRKTDEFIPLHERVVKARAANGELFISIHADALPNAQMRGASVFTLSERASDKEAAELATRENKADLIAGIDLSQHAPEVSDILLDLARRQTNNLSIGLARSLVSELGMEVKLLNNSHRSAGFAVLKAPDIPSALVELGCLSNKDEERELRQASYRKHLAMGLVRSVHDYFDHIAKA